MTDPSLGREEIAELEIGQTEITAWLARTMTLVFLAAIFVVPLAHEFAAKEPDFLATETWPRCAALFRTLPDVARAFDGCDGNLWQRTLQANRRLLENIDLYERGLREESLLVQRLLGPTQYQLTKWGRLGNEKAYLGRDGWLFYGPGVEYVTRPGFLDRHLLAKRVQAGKPYVAPPQPDPRSAILDFARQLRRREINLILLPAPEKAMVHPEQLSPRYSKNEDVLHNESFDRWKREMEREGVLVFDPATLLRDRKLRSGDAQFLKTDTHWTPAAVEAVAEQLRDIIDSVSPLPPRPPAGYQARLQSTRNQGDLAAMLRLPDDQTLFLAETVEIRQITDRDGAAWQPDPSADLLLLGDSFTNIYSQPAMNWGVSAGLAEQLSFVMQRPVDRISQNDSGAFATRRTLAQELIRGNDRLAGKRLVIWEFAVRELAQGDWKPVLLADPPPSKGTSSPDLPTDSRAVVVSGRVEATAGVPSPASVPYRNAVTSLHLSNVQAIEGASPAPQIVVYILGMRDNHLTAAGHYKPGDVVLLKLLPWHNVRSKYGSLTRIELDDPGFTLIDLPLFWGEENR